MKSPRDHAERKCLFARRYPNEEDDNEVFIALYRQEKRLILVTSEERGGDIEIELSPDDALDLLSALQRELKKEPIQPPQTTTGSSAPDRV